MDISKEAIEKIQGLVEQNQVIEIDGKKYSRGEYSAIDIRHPDRPGYLAGSTLTSLVDYLKANVECIDYKQLMIQVVDFKSVQLIERFTGDDKIRTEYFRSVLDSSLQSYRFGEYVGVEEFIIKTRALFQPTEDLETVVAIVSRVVQQDEINAADDGLSQTIQVKKGVSGALSQGIQTKGVYDLRPFRTFRELQQPASKFILRLKAMDGELPRVALFDAEGESWKYNAMLDIRDYLADALKETGIPVLA
jgi:hypothetical protein